MLPGALRAGGGLGAVPVANAWGCGGRPRSPLRWRRSRHSRGMQRALPPTSAAAEEPVWPPVETSHDDRRRLTEAARLRPARAQLMPTDSAEPLPPHRRPHIAGGRSPSLRGERVARHGTGIRKERRGSHAEGGSVAPSWPWFRQDQGSPAISAAAQ